ncbi:DUF58 domain-containing protein [Aeromonas schubertii]|uniref:DUF58 domain-containing protein n=1 Tax=Aeromonas schubertii TaxID=652 RepID=A0ABS7VEX3_9GAMM|nr:DUF58 domain-containing protein [Aeromonas schubertii]MBZ6067521.1 DUF58 domain-containing protein [Aeromonas schubertii]
MLALPLARLLATRALPPLSQERRAPLHHGRLGRQPGLTFRELRLYQAGDEVRHIDWRVTARLGRPHTRLYQEEREEARALVVNLGEGMRFGSTLQLKGRLACELASALLWQGAGKPLWLKVGDGPPQRSPRHPEPLIGRLCEAYEHWLSERQDAAPLGEQLAHLPLPHGATLHLITDHREPDTRLCQQLARLKGRCHLHLWQIVDPLELTLPPHALMAARTRAGGGWLDGERAHAYEKAATLQQERVTRALLPLVHRLYRLDNGRPLAEQWREGPWRLI